MKTKKIRVIFVCLGNICRSPLGEGVFRHLVEEKGLVEYFIIDSAGTASYHAGELPDPGSRRIAEKHGISLNGQYARQFIANDLTQWDYIIAMDSTNHSNIRQLGALSSGNLHLMREFDPEGSGDVPDPWARGDEAFLETYTIIRRSCEKLLEYIIKEHHLPQ
ncbi:phosphotyrosine protein phosphatase [Aneurinibacillus migulanus]|uniref:low molecular weight protein-tyrosine-phosphatase n=1 Tax=Aneurinibacillus migulanus TaxID=47500 RepID=UPI0005B938C4|nr:low molecular weight protein-tyrosine-phosphatase [Aneurinibacillus migulanus]KIV53573.1 phosphotyrosine protein phosphatase [Aneurinibacillus migulanus]KPD05625.1 phosphotyrosine protein phosphatase [Aneurinibacillus migulanus]